MFNPSGDAAGDSGRSARISAQIANLETHCQLVEHLWRDAWERVGGAGVESRGATSNKSRSEAVSGSSRSGGETGKSTRRGSGTSRTRDKVSDESGKKKRKDQSVKKESRTPETSGTDTTTEKHSGQTTQKGTGGLVDTTGETSASGEGSSKTKSSGSRVGRAVKRLISPTSKQPPGETSSTAHSAGASSRSAAGSNRNSAKRLSDTYGDLEAEAYKVNKHTSSSVIF